MRSSETSADALSGLERQARPRWWIRAAPAPEAPDVRDRAGAQAGMALMVGAATLFWLAVGILVLIVHRG